MGYLTARPISPAASILANEIYCLVSATEVRQRKRGKGGAQDLRRAVEAILGDLLVHHPRLIFVPSNNAEFSGMEVAARTFRACLNGLLLAGLVGQRPGFRSKGQSWTEGDPSGFGPGWAMRLWPSPTLVEMAEAGGVLPDASQHFHRPPPPVTRSRSVVQRERPSGAWKVKGTRMRLPRHDARLERLRDEVMEVNQALAMADVHGCDPPILFRSFTLTYGTDKSPALHGRWYATGSGSYIALPRKDRQRITMGGEPLAEVDVSASFFWAFHGAAERLGIVSATPVAGTDLYAVSGLPRAVVKRFMTATWGNGKLPGRWPKSTRQMLAEEDLKLADYPIAKVREGVLGVHPILNHLSDVQTAAGLHRFSAKEPHKLCSHWLMGLEATAVTRALLRLLREDSVTAMPLHDCLLVPARMADTAVYRLKEAYREVAGVEPPVKIKGCSA
ncbi:hypothetical protein ACLF3G_21975 [Falsiroseomonas sp. HC035]|uniref:hypothetical protein n=1 Tax=Falsiroseomonas sp. HC035 TaxID=3390999 RepID=UPI003D30F682